MSWSPSVTVAAVIRADDRYLMVEEIADGVSVINQPAGHLEFGESLLEAVRREVLEETAHPFEPSGLVGIYQWTVPHSDRTYLRFCFAGSVGERLADHRIDPDITAAHWLRYEQIVGGRLPLRSPLVVRCLDDLRHGKLLPLEALHALD